MKVVCSYCRDRLPDKPPLDDSRTSHGLCGSCARHLEQVWSPEHCSRELDALPEPTALLTDDGRLVALNEAMADLLSRPRTRLFGLLAGEALRCRNASLPGGCGRTRNCSRCSVRRAVAHCAGTRETFATVALLQTEDGPLPMRIRTRPRDGLVVLVIEMLSEADRVRPALAPAPSIGV